MQLKCQREGAQGELKAHPVGGKRVEGCQACRLRLLRRQYLYICTSKASKLSVGGKRVVEGCQACRLPAAPSASVFVRLHTPYITEHLRLCLGAGDVLV